MTTQEDRIAERRTQAGLPVLRCPACGGLGAHWVAATIHTDGYFTCQDKEPSPHLNPDCRDGKHAACGGDAWNLDTDTETPCECSCHEGTS